MDEATKLEYSRDNNSGNPIFSTLLDVMNKPVLAQLNDVLDITIDTGDRHVVWFMSFEHKDLDNVIDEEFTGCRPPRKYRLPFTETGYRSYIINTSADLTVGNVKLAMFNGLKDLLYEKVGDKIIDTFEEDFERECVLWK